MPFDEAASDEPTRPPHGHVPVSTGYAKATGRRIKLAAVTLAVALAAAFVLVPQIKGRQESMLATATAARAEEPQPIEVMRVDLAPPTQMLTLPGETQGWYNSTAEVADLAKLLISLKIEWLVAQP